MYSDLETIFNQAVSNYKNKNYDQSSYQLKQLIEMAQGNPEIQSKAYFYLARIFSISDPKIMFSCIDQAVTLKPDMCNEILNWAYELNKEGQKKLSKKIHKHINDTFKTLMSDMNVKNVQTLDEQSEGKVKKAKLFENLRSCGYYYWYILLSNKQS
ncbi:MAG: hypothetical protein NTW55_03580 [Planctomycetota bacterium]|nr:hypothetical protein [Planctomycetota bacterium]